MDYQGLELSITAGARNYYRWVARLFEPHTGSDVLEVGAGIGSFAECLLARPETRLTLLEPSPAQFGALSVRFSADPRINLENRTLPDYARIADDRFDTVFYVNVLEHIEEDEAELRQAAGLLKPGGRLCLFVPAIPALYSDFDAAVGHRRRYTRGRLTSLLKSAGLVPLSFRHFDFIGILPWCLFYVWLRRSPNRFAVCLYDRLAVPWMSRLETWLPPPAGKNIVMVASRPEH